MLCHYWCFKDVGYKFELHVCNKCNDVLMTAYELKNIAIWNVKGFDYWWLLRGFSKYKTVNALDFSVLEDECVL